MKDRRWIFTILCVMAISVMFAGAPLAKQPDSELPGEDEEFDETAPDTPLPPGMKERVFIHLPRAHKPGHLGTCTLTTTASSNFGLAGWHLPGGGITWKLNRSTVPATVGAEAGLNALKAAFATWTAVENSGEVFIYGGTTSVTRSRLD